MRLACALALGVVCVGCAQEPWPEPPAIDRTAYAAEYEAWQQGQQETAAYSMKFVGIWPLPPGDTAFGADSSLPVVLPASASPARAGVLTRAGNTVTVTPAPGATITHGDAGALKGPAELQGELALGSLRMAVTPMPPDRLFVMAWDENHPAVRTPPEIAAYPIDDRWRVAARFDAFSTPKPVQVADVRGGTTDFLAIGQLVFRVNGQEHRLTAFGEPGQPQSFVMFKDATNRSTTYGGFRILAPAAVANGRWTVLDFNLARNPPCAYSRFTTCPLPPPENRLDVAVEAGEKRHPSAEGFVG